MPIFEVHCEACQFTGETIVLKSDDVLKCPAMRQRSHAQVDVRLFELDREIASAVSGGGRYRLLRSEPRKSSVQWAGIVLWQIGMIPSPCNRFSFI
jgi:hypothetical protein